MSHVLRLCLGLTIALLLITVSCVSQDTPEPVAPQTARQANIYFENGKKAFDGKRYQEAIISFTAAIDIDPTRADAYTMRGLCHNKSGDQTQAIEDYNAALKRTQDTTLDSAIIYTNRGIAYLNLGEYEKAQIDATHALEIQPEYGNAHLLRAMIYMVKGEYEQALKDAEIAVDII